MDSTIISESFDICGITQSDATNLHSQLYAYLNAGMVDMVVDAEAADQEIHGFVDIHNNAIDDETLNIEEDEDESQNEDTE